MGVPSFTNHLGRSCTDHFEILQNSIAAVYGWIIIKRPDGGCSPSGQQRNPLWRSESCHEVFLLK